jgi:hypothetical protein
VPTISESGATPHGFASVLRGRANQPGRFEQHERSKSSAWSHPVVADGRLFLSDQDLLFCYDLKGAT